MHAKIAVLLVLAFFVSTANAIPINLSFESGLTSWNLGSGTDPWNISVVNSVSAGPDTLLPTDGNYFLTLYSPHFGSGPTYLWQNIGDLVAGTAVSFDWTSSGDPLFLSGNFFGIYSGASEVLSVALATAPILNGPGTSWNTLTFSLPTDLPDATFGFKVLGSPENNMLYIDNISVASVPEPSSLALLAAGVGLIGFTSRPPKRTAIAQAV